MSRVLRLLKRALDGDTPFLVDFVRRYQHCDEPQFFQYSASVNPIFTYSRRNQIVGSGFSFFSKNEAIIKCIAESAERYCSDIWNNGDFIRTSSGSLRDKAVDLNYLSPFTKDQLASPDFKKFSFDERTLFNWTEIWEYPNMRKKLIPAQLVYNRFVDGDLRFVRLPISTGAAAGFTLESALYRGICEVIERDSFMIMYLNKLCRCSVDLEKIKNPKIRYILEKAKRYLLEVRVFDITTDLGVPSFLSLVIDRSGYGMAVSSGLKADLRSEVAILGALQESFHTRSWIRSCVESGDIDPNLIVADRIQTIKERGAFWFPKKKIECLKCYLDLPDLDSWTRGMRSRLSDDKLLEEVVNILKRNNMNIFYKELASSQASNLGLRVVKVIIPQLQPLYLDERYPYLGNDRIYSIPGKIGLYPKSLSLNTCPHPFL